MGDDPRQGGAQPGRAKYLTKGGSVGGGASGEVSNDNAPAFTFTRGELGALITLAVAAALEARSGEGAAVLLDREKLAERLGCSSSLVDKLRRQGMPCVRLGDSPRFELERCLGWIRKEGAA
jgi:hypothetical protein